MTRRRWIADEVSGNRAILTGEHADHLIKVLRARVGQGFDIATGDRVRQGCIVSIADHRVEFELGDEVVSAIDARLTIFLAVFKFDRLEWAIEKCTELGVARIIPVLAHRTEKHLAAASQKRVERWRRLALQAAEQSRRIAPPEIASPMRLHEAMEDPGELRIVLAESVQNTSLNDVVAKRSGAKDILLAIGPEGGWTEDELGHFQKAGWTSASLGSAILRAETAAIAATAIVLANID